MDDLKQALLRLRQLWYPREFRIDAAVYARHFLAAAREAELEQCLQQREQKLDTLDELSAKIIVQAVTRLWEIRDWTTDLESSPDRMAAIYDGIDNLITDLKMHSVEVVALDGQDYESNRNRVQASFTASPELSKRVILKTVEPQIFWRDKLIHKGRVIVGEPTRT
jgi:hypothetical protein